MLEFLSCDAIGPRARGGFAVDTRRFIGEDHALVSNFANLLESLIQNMVIYNCDIDCVQ